MNAETKRKIHPVNSVIANSASNTRLYSLDALRGFDMMWIIGVDSIFHNLARATKTPFWNAVSIQFTHPSWNGFHFYDLIFPLFLFLTGVATPYSTGRDLENGKSRHQVLMKVIKRGLILILIGLVYNNGLQLHPLSDIRFCSVLSRIGIAYMFANVIYLFTKKRTQIVWFWGLLIGYWLLLKFTAAPGFIPGDLTMEGNFGSYIDRSILPGKLSLGIHDTVGFIFNIPATGTGLLGIFAGDFIKNSTLPPRARSAKLALFGFLFIVLGQIWNLDFPINKNLWSSSFVLHTGGLSLILLAIFYYIIDGCGYKSWAFAFKVIGMNSILIYISWRFIDWEYATFGLFKWLGQLTVEPYNSVIMAACSVVVEWFFLYFLFRNKMFFKI